MASSFSGSLVHIPDDLRFCSKEQLKADHIQTFHIEEGLPEALSPGEAADFALFEMDPDDDFQALACPSKNQRGHLPDRFAFAALSDHRGVGTDPKDFYSDA